MGTIEGVMHLGMLHWLLGHLWHHTRVIHFLLWSHLDVFYHNRGSLHLILALVLEELAVWVLLETHAVHGDWLQYLDGLLVKVVWLLALVVGLLLGCGNDRLHLAIFRFDLKKYNYLLIIT